MTEAVSKNSDEARSLLPDSASVLTAKLSVLIFITPKYMIVSII